MPATHAPGNSQAQGNRPSPGRVEGKNQQGQKGTGHRKKQRKKNTRPENSTAGGGNGRHSRRTQRGKSQLGTPQNATPEVAPYPFTTTAPAPAMMAWEDVTVQLIDTPPITADFMDPSLHGLIRPADLALLMVDLANDACIKQCQDLSDRLSRTKTRSAARSYQPLAQGGTPLRGVRAHDWLVLLTWGRSPPVMLQLMPVAAGLTFGLVFVSWLVAMRISHPGRGPNSAEVA